MSIYNKFACVVLCIISAYGCSSIKFKADQAPLAPKQANFNNKNLALVLGGGGAKGFAHVGVLEELQLAGIKPDLIIGCSAGAIVGGLYAANPDIEALKTLVLNGKKSEVIGFGVSDWPYSIYSINKLAAYLQANINNPQFAKLKIPLIVSATNLQHGNLTSFSSGDLIQPILASAALPGAFAPVEIDGQYFVDCSVADPVPVQIAKKLGYTTIVAVNIAEQLPDAEPKHIFGIMKRSMEIAYYNQSKNSVRDADVVIDFHFKDIGAFTDAHNQYLYQAGRNSAKKAIPLILEKLQRKS